MVNMAKSSFYISPKSTSRIPHVQRTIGIAPQQFPIQYLGIPIFLGKRKMVYFEHILDKVRRALEGWKARLLSFSGRVTLIKAVLTTIPIYTLASAYVPNGIIKRAEQIICNFLWHIQSNSRTYWVKWQEVCSPIEKGDLGIKRLSLIQSCIHDKLMFQVLQGTSLRARYAKAKCFGTIFRLPSLKRFSLGTLSHYDLCRASVAAYIFWEIWVARCAATFEGTLTCVLVGFAKES